MQDEIAINVPADNSEDRRPIMWIRAPYGQSPLEQLREFWRRRELLLFLVAYGVSRQHGKTLLGTSWLFIRPAIMVGGAVFVVGKMLGVQTAPVPLMLFMLASFAPWLLFQRGILMGTRSLSMYKSLLNRFLFPRAMTHIASIAPAALIFLLVFAAAVVAMVYFAIAGIYLTPIGWHIFWVPVASLMMILLVWGLSFFAAPLNAMAADTRLTMRYLLTVLMIVSPVFYPIVTVTEGVRSYMWYNPIACILELFRWGLFHQFEPSWWHVWLAMIVVLSIFAGGWWFFSRCEQKALEEI